MRSARARISFQGPIEPHLFDDIDPELLGLDLLPRLKEAMVVIGKQQSNWTIVPFPTPGWAQLVHPELEPAAAYARLWEEIERILRLDEPDPGAAWDGAPRAARGRLRAGSMSCGWTHCATSGPAPI